MSPHPFDLGRTAPAFEPEIEPLGGGLDPGLVLDCLRDLRGVVGLDSAGGRPMRYSLVGFEPWMDCGDPGSGVRPGTVAEVAAVAAAMERRGAAPGPFQGGFLGAFRSAAGGEPAVAGGFYTDFVVLDHGSGTASLVLGRGDATDRDGRRERVMQRLDRGSRRGAFSVGRIEARPGDSTDSSQELECPFSGDVVDLHLALREALPVPLAGLARWPSGGMLCASSELLLEVRGRRARSRPLLSGAPRIADAAFDRARVEELQASAEMQARLQAAGAERAVFFADHVRAGSITIGQPELSSDPDLHQLSIAVQGELESSAASAALLAALLGERAGSDGAAGALGYLDTAGNLMFAAARPSVVHRRSEFTEHLSVSAGSGPGGRAAAESLLELLAAAQGGGGS